MKVLYLSASFPYPLTSGYLRHYHFIRELSKWHEITLLARVDKTFRPEHADVMSEFATVHTCLETGKPASKLGRVARTARVAMARTPGVRAMRARARELCREHTFDAVVFSGKHTFPVLREVGELPVIVDVCDASSLRFELQMADASVPQKVRLSLKRWHMNYMEKRTTSRGSRLIFASKRDQDYLLARCTDHAPAVVVPNGVDEEYWHRTIPTLGQRTIAFSGAMQYPPNHQTSMTLATEVLPLVRAEIPDAELLLVGRDPSAELQRAGQLPGVTVTGFVDDVRPWLERATVCAAPMKAASGIQNKVLEAMAMELPIVASAAAANGLYLQPDDKPPIHVAEKPRQFADILIRLLREAEQDPTPARACRDYVVGRFNWQSGGRRLHELLSEVCPTSPAPLEGQPA